MTYRVEYTKAAVKTLSKLAPNTSALIYRWIDKNLMGCSDPRAHGKALVGSLSGIWRYRVGDYRLLADINDGKVTVLIIDVGHRREIYE